MFLAKCTLGIVYYIVTVLFIAMCIALRLSSVCEALVAVFVNVTCM